jgi:hypothetical protein
VRTAAYNIRFAAMLARRNNNQQLYFYQLISGRRISIEHLSLTSSAAILFGFGSGRDITKYQHSSKPDALAVMLQPLPADKQKLL